MLKQFVANFVQRLATVSAAEAGVPVVAAEAGAAPTVPSPPRELNGLALAWAMLRDWLRQLFGTRRA